MKSGLLPPSPRPRLSRILSCFKIIKKSEEVFGHLFGWVDDRLCVALPEANERRSQNRNTAAWGKETLTIGDVALAASEWGK